MLIRLFLLVMLAAAAWYVWRTYGARLMRDPRVRTVLAGLGPQLLRLLVLRSVLPRLVRALGLLRFFR